MTHSTTQFTEFHVDRAARNLFTLTLPDIGANTVFGEIGEQHRSQNPAYMLQSSPGKQNALRPVIALVRFQIWLYDLCYRADAVGLLFGWRARCCAFQLAATEFLVFLRHCLAGGSGVLINRRYHKLGSSASVAKGHLREFPSNDRIRRRSVVTDVADLQSEYSNICYITKRESHRNDGGAVGGGAQQERFDPGSCRSLTESVAALPVAAGDGPEGG
jgi:hypothetical protein